MLSVLYVALLVLLVLAQLVLRWRVARLERRYVNVATDAHALMAKAGLRPGNGKQPTKLDQSANIPRTWRSMIAKRTRALAVVKASQRVSARAQS